MGMACALFMLTLYLLLESAEPDADTAFPTVESTLSHDFLTSACSPTGSILCNSKVLTSLDCEKNYQWLKRALSACVWGPFVVLVFDNTSVTTKEHIRCLFGSKTLASSLHYVMHITDSEEIEDIIWSAYFTQDIRDFVFLTRNSEILNISERILTKKQCANAALITNNLRFIFVTPVNGTSEFQDTLRRSSFDNVLLVGFDQEVSAFDRAYTLMWREGRKREFQEVDDQEDNKSQSCQLFPNVYNGLNGRHFVGIAKIWQPEFTIIQNKQTGKLEFSGFYSDVFDMLAEYLNFTYTLVPEPGEDDAITWESYVEIVSKCQVDFGINLFLSNAKFGYNITTSYPVMFNDYIGVYVNKKKPSPYKLFLIFRVETFGLIFGCLLYTMSVYLIFVYILQRVERMASRAGAKKAQDISEKQMHTRLPRSSIFEIDWQSKYQRIAPENSRINIEYRSDDEVCLSSVYSRKFDKDIQISTHKTVRNNNGNTTTWRKKLRKSHDKQVYENTRTKRKNTKRNTLPNVNAGVYRGRRAEIYNNESHYTVDFTSTHFLSVMSYHTESTFVVHRHSHLQSNRSSDSDSTGRRRVKFESAFRCNVRSNYEYIVDVLFRLFGTVLNQDTLPQPYHCAPRVLLSAWSLTMIVVVATYTGNLTATFVDTSSLPSIKTFDELVSLSDFRWGISNHSTVYSMMQSAQPGTILHKLFQGIQQFSKSDPSILGDIDDMVRNVKSENFVALVASFTLRYLMDYTDLTNLAVIGEKLLNSNGAFIFPMNSELNVKISYYIVKMRDSGLINEMFERHMRKYNGTGTDLEETESMYLDMENVLGVFYISCFGAGLAFLALIGEVIVCKLVAERRETVRSKVSSFP